MPRTSDKYGNVWQYHSRSDRHSKIACWAIIFDLLQLSAMLREHVRDSKIVFGVNHEMFDFKTGRKKNLDLVIARPGTSEQNEACRTLADLADHYGVVLDEPEQAALATLPMAHEGPVGTVLMALEAKACMTAHIRSRPRLYDELNSSHLTIHGASEQAIAVGFAMLNQAETFVSSDLNKFDLATHEPNISHHRQPLDAVRVDEKLREIPRRGRAGEEGFDALGIVVVKMTNDGAPVEIVVEPPPAPLPNEPFHYDSMIRRTAHLYEVSFANI